MKFDKIVDAARREKFDIGVVGFWYADNYGSTLTYFAFDYMLKSMGYSTLFIRKAYAGKRSQDNLSSPAFLFAERNHYIISMSRHYTKMTELNDKCDTFITGSDQLWNYKFPYYTEDFYLDFVDDNKKKIAYATSFGHNYKKIPIDVRLKQKFNLENFDKISLREETSIEYAKETYDLEVDYALDPVFMIPVEEYMSLAKKSTVHFTEKYLVAYILDLNKEKADIVRQIAKELGVSIAVFTDLGKGEKGIESAKSLFSQACVVEDTTPENFLYAFENSAYVVTDSFHGACFAYIFQKPFNVFYNAARGIARFESLNMLLDGVVDKRRVFENSTDISAHMLTDIDYTVVNVKISNLRKASYKWLKDAIEAPKKSEPTLYDILKRELYKKDERISQLKYRLDEIEKILGFNSRDANNNIENNSIVQKGFTYLKEHGLKETTKKVNQYLSDKNS